jgi:hypothetical protein
MPLTILSKVLDFAGGTVGGIFLGIFNFAKWFYLTFLPFVVQYIGIPMFVLGIILALAFAGGTMLFTIVFFIFMYFFIKGTLFDSKP